MGSRSTKVVALLALLVALWGFSAWVTVRDGIDLLAVRALDARVFDPTEPLLLRLQVERRTSLAYLGRPDESKLTELAQLRLRTDQSAAEFTESVDSWQVDLLGSHALHEQIARLGQRLAALPDTRTAVDGRNIGRREAGAVFDGLIASIHEVYDELGNLDDDQVADDTDQLIRLNLARELLSQEDALLAGVLAAGRITSVERAEFTRVVGARQFVAEQAIVRLPDADQRRYEQLATGASFRRLADLEQQIMLGRGTTRTPFTAAEWAAATGPALIEVGDLVLAGGEDTVDRATPVAVGVIVRLVLAAGLGLLGVIATVIVSITTGRALARQLRRLRDAAFQIADERLPSVVARLDRGDRVKIAEETPPLAFGDDEIGEVGRAIDAVRITAVRTAVEQAELRRVGREVFLSLARRTQALVHRQLTVLDALQQREQDTEGLHGLLHLDDLATRMRRNTENLIVLSGATPGRTWHRSVPMVDVLRSAVGEVEDHSRVTVLPFDGVSLDGRPVGDVIHLMAELIENALVFSPPHTSVEVRGQLVANGFAIEIEDRGLGISDEDLVATNHRIADPSERNLADAEGLGLYVVARLAGRHEVRVRLKESAFGGTTAVVLIPRSLIVADGAISPIVGDDAQASDPGASPPTDDPDGGPSGASHRSGDDPAEGNPDPDHGPAAADQPGRRPQRPSQWDGPTVLLGPPVTSTSGGAAPWSPWDMAGAAAAVPAPVDRSSVKPAEPGEPVGAEAELTRTESGLPVRVRQASLSPALRDEPEPMAERDEPIREPEQVRRMMNSYQTGTRRGRSDAARLLGGGGRAEAGPEADDAGTGDLTR
ncbi:nitrate- and nitrite sensing domain-containing protein [Micromonospora sp. LOL_024]|uniref:sensor histidine kinase n=1 Tax=Micromonospora sp. LOL_024 TaxID=3345412 RepID=UPI003A8AE0D3